MPEWRHPRIFSLEAVTEQNIENVIAYRDALRAAKVEWRKHSGGLHYPVYDEAIEGLLGALYTNNFVQPFDYKNWYDADGHQYVTNGTLVDKADLATCIKLLTTHARVDRLLEGHFGRMVQIGHVGRILERLAVLARV